ncbi:MULTISPECIES: helix-turn-helix transcriptional regulator [Ralstonia solanacearum species complex]|uniref:Helix-turn-helix transcriptional regulator n=2 Tax=Ralstonia solanacearum species complex TaxID=3116862 RepID=A0AAD0SCF0_RALSL|nr:MULTISPECIES: helix-turn-helix transcriptional regulator [Ralstonia solanacearum species complex]AXV84492.1 helix-turn-helix transcriptional regulator [Ralstonia solanacearum]AXW55619.1 helix-turn-helix transcriptional regulator [Ralstonia solanacearum]AXW64545.1 helix-turn-helix transcriptional regulator [Ralstonia solanacearum]CBJ35850.1 putative transcription regulator protein LuxR [Ralstonia solanacearum PSI07]CCA87064.1 putative transcription regulator protein LuxR [Ralstonia syzygii R
MPFVALASRALSILLRQLYAAACTGSAADVMEVVRIAWHAGHITALVRWRHDGRWRWVASHGTHAPTLLWQAAHGEVSVTSWPLIDAEVQGMVWTSGQAEPGALPRAAAVAEGDVLPHLAQALVMCWERDQGVALGDTAASASAARLWLAEMFHLTRREVDVADLLARGAGPALIARTLGISRDTVRTHLKHVYRKTNTHGQCDVVRLMLAAAGHR